MPDAAASTITSLEAAYSRLIFETIPELSSKRRASIPGQLVVLDATQATGAVMRRVQAPEPEHNKAPEKTRAMVSDIVRTVVQETFADAMEPPNLDLVRDVVISIRRTMALDEIDPRHLRWAVEGVAQPLESTVLHAHLVTEMKQAERSRAHVVPGYVEAALKSGGESEQAFISLVIETLVATSSLPIEQITGEQLRSIHLRALPFCALGVLRGIAMWFLLDAEEAEITDVAGDDSRLVETLSTMYSTSVIDVFTAFFMTNVAGLTTLADSGSSREIIQDAMDYLYPNSGFRLIPADAPTLRGPDPEQMTLRVRQDDVRQFLGFSGATWRLVYPRPKDPDFYHAAPPDHAYHRLIEVKLQDIAIKAASEMDRQYGRLLGVFGHHSGSLFKASGAFHVWAACNRGENPTRLETKHMLDKLLPVWGISQAISLIQKVDTETGLTVPREWVDPQWLERPDIGEEASKAINQLVRYVFHNATNDPPCMPWVICSHHNTVQNLQWQADPDKRVAKLTSLPPFADDPIIFDKTLALTIGLFEMINNVRKYPPARGWGRSVRKALKKLPYHEQIVAININESPGEIEVVVEQPIFVGQDGEIPSSRSLDRIRIFEYQCLRGLVATHELNRGNQTSNPRILRVSQRWKFQWGELIQMLRRKGHGT